tara:strand:- start:32 stop:940 length:909 start_codon:yes stop_codon:yes gene_type:complete
MNELVTINTENYATMAKAMGLPTTNAERKTNSLNRFRIWHSPILGEEKVLVKGGMYRLEIVGEQPMFYFASKVRFRPFLQRFMYKRYVQNPKAKEGEKRGDYIKTIMADNLNIDLKDTAGTFNCGKPAGYVEDYQALPEATKTLIKATKRNRVVFGIVELIKPVKSTDGNEVEEIEKFPVIWEIDNRDAYKSVGNVFSKFAKMERLPLQHIIELDGTESHKSNTGGLWYTPNVKLDLTKKSEITEEDHKVFGDFLDWVKAHNEGIVAKWDEVVSDRQDDISEEDVDTVDEFINVELETDDKQ